jgi:hypothetical protein
MRTILPLLLLLGAAPSPSQEGRKFRFTHERGRPVSYAVKLKTSLAIRAGGRESMKMDVEMRFRLGLAATSSELRDSVTPVKIEPSECEGEWDLTDPSGHTAIKLSREKGLTGTRDGTVIIDKDKDKGKEASDAFRKEIAGMTAGGVADLTGLGAIRDLRGDEAFVAFWTEPGRTGPFGLFGISFPENPVSPGGTWEGAWSLRTLGSLELEGDGLRGVNRYERLPDRQVDGKTLAEFALSSPFEGQGLKGSMGQGPKKTTLDVRKYRRRGEGRFLFDPGRGVLIRGVTSAEGEASIKGSFEGRDTDLQLTVKTEMEASLEPAAP